MTSGKKSDKQYGAVLCSSLISCNRQRLADVMDEEAEQWESARDARSTDLLSHSDLIHLFGDVTAALTPLLVDEDADVRLSAAEALRYTDTSVSATSFRTCR